MKDATEADAEDSIEIDGLDLRAITCRDRRLEDAAEMDGCDNLQVSKERRIGPRALHEDGCLPERSMAAETMMRKRGSGIARERGAGLLHDEVARAATPAIEKPLAAQGDEHEIVLRI